MGTKVLAGGEVGQLDIFRDALTEGQEGVELVVSGCIVIVKYFKGLERRYRSGKFDKCEGQGRDECKRRVGIYLILTKGKKWKR